MTPLESVQCGRCKRHRPRDTTDAHPTALTGWCLDQTPCLAAALDWVRGITLDALAESVFQFRAPHQRTENTTHSCGTVGMHSLHICDCGWLWTSNEVEHTSPPPPEVDADGWPLHRPPTTVPNDVTLSAWPTFERVPPPPLTPEPLSFSAYEAAHRDTEAATNGAETDPRAGSRSTLVSILANLHDLSEQVKSIVESSGGDHTMAIADMLQQPAERIDTREVLAKIRRNRLNTQQTGILPAERPIEPWCRVCGNYTADPSAFVVGHKSPVCADNGACTGRLIGDALTLAGLPNRDTAS